MGRRLDPAILSDFSKSIRANINNVVDRGYEVFSRNAGQSTVASGQL